MWLALGLSGLVADRSDPEGILSKEAEDHVLVLPTQKSGGTSRELLATDDIDRDGGKLEVGPEKASFPPVDSRGTEC